MNLTYFILGGDFVKIGTSRDPEARLTQLAVASPVPLLMLKVAAVAEREAHRLAETMTERVSGEWFRDCPALREWIGSLADAEAAPRSPKRAAVAAPKPPVETPKVQVEHHDNVMSFDLRNFPPDVQDHLRDRAIRERRPIGQVIADYVVEVAKAIVAAAGQAPKAA